MFATRRARLAHELTRLRTALRPDAAIWVSWPKKASKVATVCAVTDVWSGLKLVVRKALR